MTGQELDAMTDAEIDALPELPVVVARCSPETKVKMVDALYRRGMPLLALDGMTLILFQSAR
jgi:Na+-exporting ATPase